MLNIYKKKKNIYIYRNIIKRQIEGKISLYSRCIDCGFKKFETIEKEELSYLLKGLV